VHHTFPDEDGDDTHQLAMSPVCMSQILGLGLLSPVDMQCVCVPVCARAPIPFSLYIYTRRKTRNTLCLGTPTSVGR